MFYTILFVFVFCFVFLLSILCILCFCIVLCIDSPLCCLFPISEQVHRPLPPGGDPIAVNKCHVMSCYVPSPLTGLLSELLIGEVVRFLHVDCSRYTDFCTVYMLNTAATVTTLTHTIFSCCTSPIQENSLQVTTFREKRLCFFRQ